MRHRKAGLKLNRTNSHLDAMFRNMVTSLFKHERIRTTDVKAKELRRWADNLITLAKRGDLHARRQALAIVREKDVVHKLFEIAAQRYGSNSGGYTRITKLGRRRGDAAPVSIVELIAIETDTKKKKKKKKPKAAAEAKPVAKEKSAAEKAVKAEVETEKAVREGEKVAAEEKPVTAETAAAPEPETLQEDADKESKAQAQAAAPLEPEETKAEKPESEKSHDKKDDTESKE